MHNSTTVIYIVSRGHSGSTLLNLMLGAHSAICSAGEIKMLGRRDGPCSCGAPTIHDCTFWRAVNNIVFHNCGVSLNDLQVDTHAWHTFAHHNTELFKAIQHVSGSSLIVDSSKSLPRMQRLFQIPSITVKPIWLVRDPRGVAWSHMKKGRDWRKTIRSWRQGFRVAQSYFREKECCFVTYESLAREPAKTMAYVMDFIGRDLEHQQLCLRLDKQHNFAGNDMRLTKSASICFDGEWMDRLSFWKKQYITAVTIRERCRAMKLASLRKCAQNTRST